MVLAIGDGDIGSALCACAISRRMESSMHRGVYLTDGDAVTLGASKGYEAVSGLRESELLGKHMADLVSHGYFDRSVTLLVLKERRPLTITQNILRTGRAAVVTGNPVFTEDGKILMVVTTVTPWEVRQRHQKAAVEPHWEKSPADLSAFAALTGCEEDFATLFPDLVFESPKIARLLERVLRVSGSDCTVLIEGESGVGKDILARAIHRLSARREGPFVKVNCAAIPDDLMESEMFGYERGAFTGALSTGKVGLIEAAHKGTLFLDEVSDLSPRLQAKMLQVLQERQFLRVGSVEPKSVDVRFVAVSNRDLKSMVNKGRFRDDLYYRLSVVSFRVPPLRERREDILPLTKAFLRRYCIKYGVRKRLDAAALSALSSYDWPGNVRELEAVIEQGVLLSKENLITERDLPGEVRERGAPPAEVSLKEAVESFEAELIQNAISRHGSIESAARSLGVHRTTLMRKLARNRSRRLQFRTESERIRYDRALSSYRESAGRSS